MTKYANYALWAALIGAVLLNTMRLYGERDGYAQRARQAEQDNADLLDLINGRKGILEHKNGRQIYTVFTPRKIIVRPTVMAVAK